MRLDGFGLFVDDMAKMNHFNPILNKYNNVT